MKKIPQRAAAILLPILILLAVVFLKWEPMTYYVAGKAAQFYGNRAHIALDIAGIGGSPLSKTSIANISVRPAAGEPQVYHFKAEAINCTYNLWDLKEGIAPFLEGLSCTVIAPKFSYDFRVETQKVPAREEPAQFLLPALLPRLALQNGTILLMHPGWGLEMVGVDASLRSMADAGHELNLEVNTLRFSQEGATRIETGVTALLRYSKDRLTVDSFEAGGQEIRGSGFIDLAQIDKGITGFAADLVFAESRLDLTGSMENTRIKAHAKTDNLDIGKLQKRLGGAGWNITGKMRAEADFTYDPESKENLDGSFTVAVREGQMHGVDLESISAVGSFDHEIFKVSIAEARTPGNHVLFKDVSAPMPLLQGGDVLSILGGSRAVFQAEIADFATLLQLIKVEGSMIPEAVRPNSVTIRGFLEKGVVNLEGGRAETTDSSLTVDRATIPIPAPQEAFASVPVHLAARIETSNIHDLAGQFGDISVKGQAAADIIIAGSIREPEVTINLNGRELAFKEMRFGAIALQGVARISQEKLGTIKAIEFEIAEMTQENDFGTLALYSPIAGIWKPESFAASGVFRVDGRGEVSMRVAKAPGRETSAEITASNLDSDGWLAGFMDTRYFFHNADIEAVFSGLPQNPQARLAGRIGEAGSTGMPSPLSGVFRLHYSSKGIEISEFTWKSHEKNEFIVTGFLPYDPLAPEPFLDGAMALDGHVDFQALEDIAVFPEPWDLRKGSATLDVSLTGSWQQPVGHILLKAKGLVPPDVMLEYTDAPMDLFCDLAAASGSIVLHSATLESGDYKAQATGSWQHGLTVKELLQMHRSELRGDISADATGQLKNLNIFKKKLPWLRRFDGETQVRLHVIGPASDPTIQGSFSLENGEVSHTFNLPMLSAVNLQGEFDAHSITIKSMQAEVGGSPVNLSGIIEKEKGIIAVNLHVDGKNLLLFRNNDMQMRGDAQLEVAGPLDRLVIRGTTGLTGGYYTRKIDFLGKIGSSTAPVSEGGTFLFSFTEPPLKNAVFDIKITTIEPFRIRNNLVRGTLRPELFLKGTGELPFLVGTVYIDPSRVLLPSGRLQVQSGLIRFLESDPDRPRLDLLANSKVSGYDINVVAQGPLDDPVITLSSSPALPNDDLLLLLLTGQPPQQDATTATERRGAANVMVYLGRDFLGKWLEDESGTSEETMLDRFELDYGRSVTKSGEQTIESTFRLSQQTAGKGRVYYLAGEKDRYDAYNYGLRVVFRFE